MITPDISPGSNSPKNLAQCEEQGASQMSGIFEGVICFVESYKMYVIQIDMNYLYKM